MLTELALPRGDTSHLLVIHAIGVKVRAAARSADMFKAMNTISACNASIARGSRMTTGIDRNRGER
jgi:hypothetical protein